MGHQIVSVCPVATVAPDFRERTECGDAKPKERAERGEARDLADLPSSIPSSTFNGPASSSPKCMRLGDSASCASSGAQASTLSDDRLQIK
mmetsp:Transcript_7001/g.17594  ORF Transcript_7001/g.17594 Transcript_7001/m.17594 type:complete len:91 (-) Transcript_7001:517-789(-)